MYSTGLDSFILKKLHNFKDEECLFVQLGTDENEMEEDLLEHQSPNVKSAFMPLDGFELPNKIIPFRNHFLALMAAQMATEIYFGFTAGDTTRDKDYVFKAQMEGILNYFIGVPDKSPFAGTGDHYQIVMPFKDMTKVEIVREYLLAGHKAEDLFKASVSCYEGSEIPCGKCRSCLRKYVALTLNEIDCTGRFAVNPKRYLKDFLKESKKKDRKTEIKDIEKCIHIQKRF